MNRAISCMFNRVVNTGRSSASLRNLSSGRRSVDEEPRITLTDDGTTIVCWHPEKQFPYEHSLPYVEEEDRSVLKLENVVKGENMYYQAKSAGISTMEEVQAITFTPKHVWTRKRFHGLQMRPAHPRKGV